MSQNDLEHLDRDVELCLSLLVAEQDKWSPNVRVVLPLRLVRS